jgi:hypothetical protein
MKDERVGSADLPFLASAGEMGRHVARRDWASTSLGPVEQWSPTLRTAVSIMLEFRSTGAATWRADQLLVMDRRGFVEDTYWTYSYSAVRDSSGEILGVSTATNDTTGRVLGERRLHALATLGERQSRAARPGMSCR